MMMAGFEGWSQAVAGFISAHQPRGNGMSDAWSPRMTGPLPFASFLFAVSSGLVVALPL